MRRDFAFVLDADVAAGDVVKAALAVDKKLIAGVSVFDLFEGESLGAGQEIAGAGGHPAAEGEDLDGRRRSRRSPPRIIAAVGKATGGEIRK